MRSDRPWLASTTGNLVVKLFGLVHGIVLARALGPSGRGLITSTTLWSMLILGVGTIITVRCVTYFGARFGADGFRALLPLGTGFALTMLPVTMLVLWATLGLRERPNYFAANVYAITVPLSMVASMVAAALLVERRVGAYWVNEAVTAGGTAVWVILMASLGRLTPMSFAVGAVISVGSALVITARLQRSFSFAPGPTKERLEGKIIGYGSQIASSHIPFQLTTRLDLILVSMATPMATLGNYAVAAAWSSVLSVIGVGFSTVVLADSAQLDVSSPSDAEIAIARLRRATLVVFAVGVMTSLAAPIAIPILYGADFKGAIAPAMILAIASIPLYFNLMLHEFSRGIGLQATGWLPEVVGVTVLVVLLKVLFARFGVMGAASASLLSLSVVSLLLFHRLSKSFTPLRARNMVPETADLVSIWGRVRELSLPWLRPGRTG